MREMLGTTLGKYSLVSLLGKGGMANVYKAHQPRLDRYVAIKVLHAHLSEEPDFVGRFEREATAVARLNHPSIVKIYDFDAEDGLYYMVMELVDGPTLQRELEMRAKQQQPLMLSEIGQIALETLSAVSYAHRHGVVHRDLKPGNVMLTGEGRVVVTDFGLAHIVGGPHFTRVGTTSGTPEYMSPEQAQGNPGDERSDIYSLGVMLYEMTSGQVPFDGETPLAILKGHISNVPTPPTQFSAELPPEIEGVILTALAKDPAERYSSIDEMRTALSTALHLADQSAEPLAVLAPARVAESGLAGRTPLTTDLRGSRPYRGLFAFREEDALYFFGREVFTDRLLEAVEENKVIAVVGPSGSGKSSVVFAGLVPRLRSEGNWTVVHFRPSSRPFQSLADAFVQLLEPGLSEVERLVATGKMAQSLTERSLTLPDVIARFMLWKAPSPEPTEADTLCMVASDHPRHLLLVADQFEELYTLCADPETRQRFTAALLEAAGDGADSSCTLVLTLRADFMGQALADRSLADALQDGDVMLGPMTREELSRAIEQPATRLGVSFEPGLVERILDDVGTEPGNLPLLEFALTLVWDRRAGRRLTHAAYEAIGRVEGSLARYADKVYARLSEDEKLGARRLFTQMVRPGEGTEDTRRQATRGEIGEEDWPLAQRLADERLVVTGRDVTGQETVEVIHEALIRGWRRLQEWMTADRTFRAWQERLRAALRQWEDSDHDEALLLRGSVLNEAQNWRVVRDTELGAAEKALIEASEELRAREAAEKQAQRERELEAARKLAESERQRAETQALAARKLRQRAWFLTGALAIAVVLAVLAAIFGYQSVLNAQQAEEQRMVAVEQQQIAEEQRSIAETQRQEAEARRLEAEEQRTIAEEQQLIAEEQRAIAEEQRRIALSRQLAAQSATLLANKLDLAMLLALEAGRIAETPETRSSLLNALLEEPRLLTFLHDNRQIQEAAFSPDGSRMVSVGAGGMAVLWQVEMAEDGWPTFTKLFDLVGHDPTQLVNSAAFSPDGTMVATGSDDYTVKVWDVASGEELHTLSDYPDYVQSVAFSPDGSTLAAGGGGGSVLFWDTTSWELSGNLPGGPTAIVWHLLFSPDGETLAVANYYGSVALWDWRAGQQRIEPLVGFPGVVVRVAFSPDGGTLATAGSGDTVVRLWDVTTGTRTGAITTTHEAIIRGLAFTPDGGSLLTRGYEGDIDRWDLATGKRIGEAFPGNNGQLINVVLSPDGRLLVSSDNRGVILVWDLEGTWQLHRPFAGHRGRVYTVDVSPDGHTVASSCQDGTVMLHDVTTGELVVTLTHSSPELPALNSVALTPDGAMAYAGYADGGMAIWPMDQEEGLFLTTVNIQGHLVMATSLDGTMLAVGDTSGRVALWDAAAGRYLGNLNNATDPVTSLALGLDGEFVAIGRSSGTVRLWHFESGMYLALPTLTGLDSGVRSVALAADRQLVAAGGEDGSIVIWNLADGEETARITAAHSGAVLALSWGPDGLLSTGPEGSVYAWDLTTDPPVGRLILASVEPLDQAAFYSTTLALGYADGTIDVWDLGQPEAQLLVTGMAEGPMAGLALGDAHVAAGTTNGTVQVWDLAAEGAPQAWAPTSTAPTSVFETAYSPDGQTLVSGANNGTVMVWDVSSGQPRGAPLAAHIAAVTALAFSPDGQTFASGACGHSTDDAVCDQSELLVWSLDGGDPVRLVGHEGVVYSVAFSPDGRVLASGGCGTIDVGGTCMQGEVILWDVATGQPIGEPLIAGTRELYAVAFSPDGQLLASGSVDSRIMLWDVATHQQIGQSLLKHPAEVSGLAFSPDGTILASSGFGALSGNQYGPGPVILWDVATGQPIGAPLIGHQGGVWTVDFSPNGQWLVSGGSDRMVLVWDMRLATWRQRACRVAHRNMTPTEWTQFFGAEEDYQETCP